VLLVNDIGACAAVSAVEPELLIQSTPECALHPLERTGFLEAVKELPLHLAILLLRHNVVRVVFFIVFARRTVDLLGDAIGVC